MKRLKFCITDSNYNLNITTREHINALNQGRVTKTGGVLWFLRSYIKGCKVKFHLRMRILWLYKGVGVIKLWFIWYMTMMSEYLCENKKREKE